MKRYLKQAQDKFAEKLEKMEEEMTAEQKKNLASSKEKQED
jgi:hypothetical protein